jgi:hypothetical protein
MAGYRSDRSGACSAAGHDRSCRDENVAFSHFCSVACMPAASVVIVNLAMSLLPRRAEQSPICPNQRSILGSWDQDVLISQKGALAMSIGPFKEIESAVHTIDIIKNWKEESQKKRQSEKGRIADEVLANATILVEAMNEYANGYRRICGRLQINVTEAQLRRANETLGRLRGELRVLDLPVLPAPLENVDRSSWLRRMGARLAKWRLPRGNRDGQVK